MRALTWQGKRDVRVDSVPDPEIRDTTDIIVAYHVHRRLRFGSSSLPERLDRARARGVHTLDLNEYGGGVAEEIHRLTDGRGTDAVIDALGVEGTGLPPPRPRGSSRGPGQSSSPSPAERSQPDDERAELTQCVRRPTGAGPAVDELSEVGSRCGPGPPAAPVMASSPGIRSTKTRYRPTWRPGRGACHSRRRRR